MKRLFGIIFLTIWIIFSGVVLLFVGFGSITYYFLISTIVGNEIGLQTWLIGMGVALPFFALSALNFVVAMGLYNGKRWARSLTICLVGISIILAVFIIIFSPIITLGANVLKYGPMIIINFAVWWYLSRPHVIKFFTKERNSD
jgi:hypothetical protein